MAKEKINILDLLKRKLEEEIDFKKRCDNGEVSYWDVDYEDHMMLRYEEEDSYSKNSRWNDIFQMIDGMDSAEIDEGLQAFLREYGTGEYQQYIPSGFISKMQLVTRKARFEQALMRDDVVEYFSSKSKEELESEFGEEVARLKDFDQKNPHHCYDLLGHTLHTVDGIKRDGLTPTQFKELRIAAFLHDIGKPQVAKMHPKIKGQQVFYGHAEKSAEIARSMLTSMGYGREEIDRMTFYIGHHDDFISYRTQDQITPDIANHEFIRGITPESVAEIMFQNEYARAFENRGFNKDQVRYVCYALAHGQEPRFVNNGRPVKINSSMEDAVRVVREDTYGGVYTVDGEDAFDFSGRHSLEDYQMLMHLCRADAGAQSEVVMANGKVTASRAGKISNMDSIDASLPEAKRIFDLVKLSNLFLGNIAKASPKREVIDMDELTPEEEEALWEEEEQYIDEYGDYSNEYMHIDVSNWINLMGKSSAFLADLKRRIEEQKGTALGDDIDLETFMEYYEDDMQDLDRITRVRTRKEHLRPLEARLAEEETTSEKLTEAEQLLLQVQAEKRKEEGR